MLYEKGRLIKDGGEGYIYEVKDDPNLLMKIYKETDSSGAPIITSELQSKIEYMMNNPPENLVSSRVVAWPIELLNDEQDNLIGFVMPKLDIDEHLQRVYSYRHPESDLKNYVDFPSVKSRISIAINLSSALHELHRNGYVIGDFNHENIGVNYKNGQISFVDCDSFHITDETGNVHRTNVIMPGYLAPEIIGHCNEERAVGRPYNLDKVSLPTFTKESDLFCLAIHIFKLLMNGVDPFRGVKSDATGSTASPFIGNDAIERNAYVFRDGNKPSAVFCPPSDSLMPEILCLFNSAFIDGAKGPFNRPSAETWYNTLNDYLVNKLTQCSKNTKHQYYDSLSICPYCEADDRHFVAQGGKIEPDNEDVDFNDYDDDDDISSNNEPSKNTRKVAVIVATFVLIFIAGLIVNALISNNSNSSFSNNENSSYGDENTGIEINYIHDEGGVVWVYSTTEFSFTPNASGTWEIITSKNESGDPYLWLHDSHDNLITEDDDGADGNNSLISVHLTEGTQYTICAGFLIGESGRYKLTVTMPEKNDLISGNGGNAAVNETMPTKTGVISGNGGNVVVNETTDYSFTPNASGTWEIKTSESGSADPYLWLYNSYNHLIAEDDDGADGYNSLLFMHLTEGTQYTIRAGFHGSGSGSYKLTVTIPMPITARPTASSVIFNGKTVSFNAYNIDDSNYFMLRDLAYILSGTKSQFDVTWDGTQNAIFLTTGKAYTTIGGEMSGKGTGEKKAVLTTSRIYLDGAEVSFKTYNIDNNNYIKLRDVAAALDFGVDWSDTRKNIIINTTKGYNT